MRTFTLQHVQKLVLQHWAIEGLAIEMPSYADRNFKINAGSKKYVLKIANPSWSYHDLDFENAALLHLEKNCSEITLPKVKLTSDGRHIIPYTTLDGQICHLRLLSYIDGEVYANVAKRQGINLSILHHSLGNTVAKLGLGLIDFQHINSQRFVDWNIYNLTAILEEISSIEDRNLRAVVMKHCAFYVEHEKKWLKTLPLQVIHNDANDYNTLIEFNDNVANDKNKTAPTVNAIIDFGDMCHSFRLIDLAIAMTYAMQHVKEDQDVLNCAVEILNGYQAQVVLLQDELDVLYHFIMARLCQSILMANKASRELPDNTYIMISQREVRRLIMQLDAMGGDMITLKFSHALCKK